MLGPEPGARGSVAELIETYRAQGLFTRWPIDYLPLTPASLRKFVGLLLRERSLVVHLHASPGRGLWRDALFMALARLARCPVILHLHDSALQRLHDETGRSLRGAIRFFLEEATCIVVPSESQRAWAKRLGISVPTLIRLERGDAGVGIGIYATALWLIGRAGALPDLAAPSEDRGALESDVPPAMVAIPADAELRVPAPPTTCSRTADPSASPESTPTEMSSSHARPIPSETSASCTGSPRRTGT